MHLLYAFIIIQWFELHEYSPTFHLEEKVVLDEQDNAKAYAYKTLSAKQSREGRTNWDNKNTRQQRSGLDDNFTTARTTKFREGTWHSIGRLDCYEDKRRREGAKNNSEKKIEELE